MKQIKADLIRQRKRRIRRRLEQSASFDRGIPMFAGQNVHYELAEKAGGTAYGGIAAVHTFVRKIGLSEAIDRRLHLFKRHAPYHESDHVLNFAYNALCGAVSLQDIETRRNDEHYLDSIGTERIPDPTTAGDFCRRFSQHDIKQLHRAFDEIRVGVWKQQPTEFFDEAVIDMDGTIVGTTGRCKQGMDLSYKNIWGYHPLLITLANTGEVLRVINRSGNSNSARGASEQVNEVIKMCSDSGFRRIALRGDTAFTQTKHLDRWDEQGVRFVFGIAGHKTLVNIAENIEESAWKRLPRAPKYDPSTPDRSRPQNVKREVIDERGYRNRRLNSEWFVELPYRPQKCKKTYRLVIVRKDVEVTEQGRLFDDCKYFFYLSNESTGKFSSEQIVFASNKRCNQENIIAQLGQCRALHAPVDSLTSNWAFMLMTSLCWTLKAWIGLSIPVVGRHRQKHDEQRHRVIQMEHRTFVERFIRLPAQIIRSGRRLTVRLLSLTEDLDVFNRWLQFALE